MKAMHFPWKAAPAVLSVLLCAGRISADDLYVSTAGDNTAHANWSTAYTNLQDALNAAGSNDTIHVAGQPIPLGATLAWNRSFVSLVGGYAATNDADLPGANDPARWPTVITRGVTNLFRLVTMTNVTGAVLRQVTLTGGYAQDPTNAAADTIGGGLTIRNATNVLVASCIFSNNQAESTASSRSAYGGGVYAGSSSVTFSNCVIANNAARALFASGNYAHGGGLFLGANTVAFLRDCVVAYNRVTKGENGRFGGGLYSSGKSCAISNCLFYGNSTFAASRGGIVFNGALGDGIYNAAPSAMTIQYSTVAFNSGHGVYRGGGGVTNLDSIIWGNGDDLAGSVTLARCDVSDGDGRGANGNFQSDPLFEYGFYLAPDSLCLDAGGATADAAGLAGMTTSAGGAPDGGTADIGFHASACADTNRGDLYVAESGSDGNDGSPSAPFRSVTRALALARDGSRIHVAAGRYSAATGEVFPLAVSNLANVRVLGGGAGGTVLSGGGAGGAVMTLNLCAGVGLSGLTLTGGHPSNSASTVYGGGLDIRNCGGVLVSACTVSNNLAESTGANNLAYGGGISVQGSSAVISNCLVKGNTVRAANASGTTAFGGGVSGLFSYLLLADSVLAHNRVQSSANGNYGGGLYNKGTTCWARNCLVAGNSAYNSVGGSSKSWGDGIHGGYLLLQNDTIAGNLGQGICQDTASGGGAVAATNCIVWANGDDIVNTVTMGFCDVEDGDGAGANGGLSTDPRFERGFYLAAGSPCADAGSDTAASGGLAGATTRADGTPDDGTVDLGYHYAAGYGTPAGGDLYVSEGGNDAHDGSAAFPLRSVTRALALATDGGMIHVGAGRYSAASGEVFPLRLDGFSGLALAGDGAAGTVISAAGGTQGVMVVTGCANAAVSGVTLSGGNATNSGTCSGGGAAVWYSSARFTGCAFLSNTVGTAAASSGTANGGGLYVGQSVVTLSNCVVLGNAAFGAANYAYGGGVCNGAGGQTLLRDCVIAYNRVPAGSNGRMGGGLFTRDGLTVLRNCLVYANTTWFAPAKAYGDGVMTDGGTLLLTNCTVAGNAGAGLYQKSGTLAADTSIAWGNGTDVGGTVTLTDCDVGIGGTPGARGCFSADPRFEYGFYLAAGSPCLDAGSVSASAAGLDACTTAADGAPDGGTVDLGYHAAAGADTSRGDLYVAEDGSDANDGSAGAPFRSVTRALTAARDGSRLHIGPGSYTAGSGESFPLALRNMAGVSLLGSGAGATVISAAGGTQGVASVYNCANVRLSGLTLTGGLATNSSPSGSYGGGLAAWYSGGLSLSACSFSNNAVVCTNSGSAWGGGVYLGTCAAAMTNCLVVGNSGSSAAGGNYSYGGGLALQNGSTLVGECLLAGNRLTRGSNGQMGGGLHADGNATLLRNCLLATNGTLGVAAKGWGDALCFSAGSASLLNCTVAGHPSSGLWQRSGAGVACTNCLFWSNTDDVSNAVTLAWCDLQTADAFWTNGVNGCLSSNPLFRNAGAGEYALGAGSPCLEGGTNLPELTGGRDLAGRKRLVSRFVDLGCYERPLASGALLLVR